MPHWPPETGLGGPCHRNRLFCLVKDTPCFEKKICVLSSCWKSFCHGYSHYNPHPFLHSGVHLSVDELIALRNGFKATQMHPADGYINEYIDYICMDTLTTWTQSWTKDNKGIISTSYTYVNHSEINLALVEIQFSTGFSLLNDRDSNLGVPDKHWRKMWRCTFLWGSIHRARGSSKCKWMMIFWMWLKMGVTFDRRWFCGFSCGGISSSSLKIVKAWRLCFINKTRWEETSKFNQSCHHLLLQF